MENNIEILKYAEQKLNVDRWISDEIVANRFKLEEIYSFLTLTFYRSINKGLLNIDVREVLKFKGKKKRSNKNFNDVRKNEINTKKSNRVFHIKQDFLGKSKVVS